MFDFSYNTSQALFYKLSFNLVSSMNPNINLRKIEYLDVFWPNYLLDWNVNKIIELFIKLFSTEHVHFTKLLIISEPEHNKRTSSFVQNKHTVINVVSGRILQ